MTAIAQYIPSSYFQFQARDRAQSPVDCKSITGPVMSQNPAYGVAHHMAYMVPTSIRSPKAQPSTPIRHKSLVFSDDSSCSYSYIDNSKPKGVARPRPSKDVGRMKSQTMPRPASAGLLMSDYYDNDYMVPQRPVTLSTKEDSDIKPTRVIRPDSTCSVPEDYYDDTVQPATYLSPMISVSRSPSAPMSMDTTTASLMGRFFTLEQIHQFEEMLKLMKMSIHPVYLTAETPPPLSRKGLQ